MEQPNESSSITTFEQGDLIYVKNELLTPLQEEFGCKLHDIFGKLVVKHIKASDGLLEELPYNPVKYPGQRLDIVEIRAKNQADVAQLEGLATTAYNGYPLIKQEYSHKKHQGLWDAILLDLEAGQDQLALFDHRSVLNTPEGGIAAVGEITEAARRLGVDIPMFWPRITFSKILTRTKALGLPVMDLLPLMGIADMSLPPSKSVQAAGITPEDRVLINKGLKEVRVNFESEHLGEAVFDIMSPSASVDIVTYRFARPHVVHMQPMSSGTADRLTEARSLPISLNVTKSKPVVKIGRRFNPVEKSSNRQEAHAIMTYLAQLATEASGVSHRYHTTKESFDRDVAKRRQI